MGTLLKDLRYGLRVLLKSPGFTAVAVLTLALGVGANAAMFSLVNGVLLRGLPFPEPERLVIIYSASPQFPHMSSSYPNYLDWAARSKSFSAMSAFRYDSFNLTGQGQPERVKLAMVSAAFFPMLDVKPVLGRSFTADEDRRGGPPAVMLGTSYWKERFGADPKVLGRTLVLNGRAHTVVGVATSDIAVYRDIKAYLPIGGWEDPIFWNRAVSMGMNAIGRLKSGVSQEQAQSEMTAIARGLAQEYPNDDKDKGIALVPLREDLVGDIRGALLGAARRRRLRAAHRVRKRRQPDAGAIGRATPRVRDSQRARRWPFASGAPGAERRPAARRRRRCGRLAARARPGGSRPLAHRRRSPRARRRRHGLDGPHVHARAVPAGQRHLRGGAGASDHARRRHRDDQGRRPRCVRAPPDAARAGRRRDCARPAAHGVCRPDGADDVELVAGRSGLRREGHPDVRARGNAVEGFLTAGAAGRLLSAPGSHPPCARCRSREHRGRDPSR